MEHESVPYLFQNPLTCKLIFHSISHVRLHGQVIVFTCPFFINSPNHTQSSFYVTSVEVSEIANYF